MRWTVPLKEGSLAHMLSVCWNSCCNHLFCPWDHFNGSSLQVETIFTAENTLRCSVGNGEKGLECRWVALIMRKTLASSDKTVLQAFRSFQSLSQLNPERSSCFFSPSILCMAENSSDGSFSKWVCEDSGLKSQRSSCTVRLIFVFTAKGKRKWCPPVTFSAPTAQFHSPSWKHFYPLGVLTLCIYPLCQRNAFSALWRRQRRKHKKVSLPAQIWKQPFLHFSVALYHQQTIRCIRWLTLSLDASGRGSNFSGNTFHLYSEIKLTFRFGRMPPQLRNACLKSECQSLRRFYGGQN